MQILNAAMMVASIYAVNLGIEINSVSVTRYTNAAECTALSNSTVFHYEFEKEACACFLKYDIPFDFNCGEDEVFNPLHSPFATEDVCITAQELYSIYSHNFGHDCNGIVLADVEMDNEIENDIGIITLDEGITNNRFSMTPADCAADEEFDNDLCACVKT